MINLLKILGEIRLSILIENQLRRCVWPCRADCLKVAQTPPGGARDVASLPLSVTPFIILAHRRVKK